MKGEEYYKNGARSLVRGVIHKSKSGKLAWSDKFLAGQPRREGPRDLSPAVKVGIMAVGIVVVLLVASGFHRHFIGGG